MWVSKSFSSLHRFHHGGPVLFRVPHTDTERRSAVNAEAAPQETNSDRKGKHSLGSKISRAFPHMITLSRYLGKSPELESSRLKDNKDKQQETKIYKNKNVTMRLFFTSYYCLLVNYYF